MKIEIKTLKDKPYNNMEKCLEVIHKVAELNGSKHRCTLVVDDNTIKCKLSYANSDYTIGYYAVLYLIDSLNIKNRDICYTSPNKNTWFEVSISDAERLINYLMS